MSIEQIEEQIRQLPARDLVRLTEWFTNYLSDRRPSSPASPDTDWPESPELVAELERRLAEFKSNPAIATPFEPDYFDNLKRQLADERAQKASAR
ncbi:MAG TPA: hypothetical protein VGK40_10455 [Verrucomicrobiae bacterium]|jgi:hypothetical protein